MFFGVYNIQMQQKKTPRSKRDSKPSQASHFGQKVSTLASNRSQDTRSKIISPKDSYLRQFKKPKAKINTLSSISSIPIEEQIKKEIGEVGLLLKSCEATIEKYRPNYTQKEEIIQLEEVIRHKDETIKALSQQIDNLKRNDKMIAEEDSNSQGNRATDSSQKTRLFKLAEQIKLHRNQLQKSLPEVIEKHQNYEKIKKLIEDIENKYTQKAVDKNSKDQHYHGPILPTYEEFKEKIKLKKEEPTSNKIKKVDILHHLMPEKAAPKSTERNMKELITRKNITLAALKNSRKKHAVEMAEMLAKLDFLKDEDAHLNEKIKEKQHELAHMERKFSEKKGQALKFSHKNMLFAP